MYEDVDNALLLPTLRFANGALDYLQDQLAPPLAFLKGLPMITDVKVSFRSPKSVYVIYISHI